MGWASAVVSKLTAHSSQQSERRGPGWVSDSRSRPAEACVGSCEMAQSRCHRLPMLAIAAHPARLAKHPAASTSASVIVCVGTFQGWPRIMCNRANEGPTGGADGVGWTTKRVHCPSMIWLKLEEGHGAKGAGEQEGPDSSSVHSTSTALRRCAQMGGQALRVTADKTPGRHSAGPTVKRWRRLPSLYRCLSRYWQLSAVMHRALVTRGPARYIRAGGRASESHMYSSSRIPYI